jgi:hypothetical protein
VNDEQKTRREPYILAGIAVVGFVVGIVCTGLIPEIKEPVDGTLIPTKVEGIWKLEPKVEYTQEEFDALPPAPRPPTDDEFKPPMTFVEEE